MNEILEILKTIISENSGIDRNSITPESSFYCDLGIESITFSAILADIEKRFKVEIDNKTEQTIKSVRDCCGVIKKLIKEKNVH